jgi:hypothetical protein
LRLLGIGLKLIGKHLVHINLDMVFAVFCFPKGLEIKEASFRVPLEVSVGLWNSQEEWLVTSGISAIQVFNFHTSLLLFSFISGEVDL